MPTLNLVIPEARKDGAVEALFRARRGFRSSFIRLMLWFTVIAGITAFGLFKYQNHRIELWVIAAYHDVRDAVHEVTAERFVLGEVTGLSRVSRAEVAAATGLPRMASLLEFDTEVLRQQIAELPWVADAEVTIQSRHQVAVHVTEEVVAAVWRDHDRRWLVNKRGELIEAAAPGPAPKHMPVLVGAEAPLAVAEVLALRVAHPALTTEFAEFHRIGGRRWDGILYDGTVIMFPEGNLMSVVDHFVDTNRQAGLLEHGAARIDLRVPNVITVRYQGEALERYLDSRRTVQDGQGA